MRHVIQQHRCGCVPAALAMLTGRSYAAALRMFPNHKASWNKSGVRTRWLPAALERFGVSTRLRKKVGTRDALVIVNWDLFWEELSLEERRCPWPHTGCKHQHLTHAVAWDGRRQKFLDPWVGCGRGKQPRTRHVRHRKYLCHVVAVYEVV